MESEQRGRADSALIADQPAEEPRDGARDPGPNAREAHLLGISEPTADADKNQKSRQQDFQVPRYEPSLNHGASQPPDRAHQAEGTKHRQVDMSPHEP